MEQLEMKKDSIEHIENSDLVQMSRKLLEALIKSTAILNGGKKSKMSEQGLKEARAVLGYLNASINATRTKLQWFKLTGLQSKIDKVRSIRLK